MKQRTITFILSMLLLLGTFAAPVYPQRNAFKYYRLDKVKTVTGQIQEIKSEKCYQGRDFIIIYLKEKKSGDIYRVEVSPEWFFHLDLMQGSLIEVTGSYNKEADSLLIMTRSITFQGETYQFRDKFGFPLWRGKMKRGKGRGKGQMRRRGHH